MRDASVRFKESNANPEFVINIILNDDTELELTNKDIFSGGIEIADAVSSNSTFDIGACLCRQLILRLNNDGETLSEYDFANAQVRLVMKKTVDDAVESINLGRYIVDLPEFSGITITLNCLDRMILFSKKIESVSGDTAGAVVNSMCTSLGISLATQRFNGWDLALALPDVSDMTYIELLSYICQATCNFGRINDAGQLEIKWYDTSVFDDISQIDARGFDKEQSEIIDGGNFTTYQSNNIYDAGTFDGSKYHHLHSNKSENILTDDVVITGVTVKNEDTEYLYGTEGYVLLIEDNPLTAGKEQQYAERIGLRCVGMRFRPFTISAQSNVFVEAGDACIITDRKGNSYYSYVTSTTYKAGANQDITCSAESPVLNSADKFSLVTKAVIKARKETEQRITAYDIAVQQLTELMANSFGVFKTAEEQEDGSFIYYMHNRPTLEESQTIWKMTSDAFAVSTDGGNTWNAGLDAQGNAVVNILNAIGINADWINAGTLTGRAINNGNGTFKVDENGNVIANALKSNNAEITGGKVNIETASESDSRITLVANTSTGQTYLASLSPSGLKTSSSITENVFTGAGMQLYNSATGKDIIINPGAILIESTAGNLDAGFVQITPDFIQANIATGLYIPNAAVTCDKIIYNSHYETSDGTKKKYKRSIRKQEKNLLDLLIPCSYKYKNNVEKDNIRRFGLYAQDVIKAMDELGMNSEEYGLVAKFDDGTYGIKYTELIPLLLEDRNIRKAEFEQYKKQNDLIMDELLKRIEVLEHGDN